MIKPERNGLINLSQRMLELGGSCVVTSQSGKGCRVEFNIPLKRPRRGLWRWFWDAGQFSERMSESIAIPANETFTKS
jgi:hypothetical protein